MRILFLTLLLLALAIVLLGVRVLFVKGGKFPSSHVSANPALKKRGIGCAGHSDNE